MKNVLILIFVFSITAIGHAQQAGQFTIGGRLGPVFGVHNAVDLESSIIYGAGTFLRESNVVFNLNFVLYGSFAILDNFSVQAELNFMIGQGYELRMSIPEFGSGRGRVTYTSLDMPILLRYNFLEFPQAFGVQSGPHISLPFGRGELSGGGFREQFEIDTFVTFGFTAGFFSGTPMGPGRIVGDMRFIVDLNAVEARIFERTMGIMRRRAFLLSIGYEISF